MSSLLPGEIVHYRSEIDKIDFEIIKLLFERMKLAERIGEIKSIFQIPVFQPERWQEILSSRPAWAEQSGLTSAFIEKMWELIHNESINIQNQTIKATEKNASKKSV
jgi:chorismate mutase